MKIEIILADNTNGFIIKNIYPLYLHDLAGIHGTLPNEYGIFEEGPIRTLAEQYDVQQVWFDNPDLLYPYLIMVDNVPAGFCLIVRGKYAPKEVDYFVYETFLLCPYRGKAISYQAVTEIFGKHHGKWMLYTHSTENNIRAKSFWHKTVGHYTGNNYKTEEQVFYGMPKLVFKFEN
jgi:predicted acetyltransferase